MRSADSAATIAVKPDGAADLAAAHRVLDYAGEAIRTLNESIDGAFTRAVNVMLATKGRVI
ncbi:MAG TPA: hypothetical protein VHW69_08755, partial [Rhizomicrobium sp.]|nr:hypothetical protein [Rhizomicrobium sp.]